MNNKNVFWLITLCFLLILANSIGLNIPLKIALGANSVIILIDVIKTIVRWHNERKKA